MNFALLAYAITMIASGILMLVNGGFYSPWAPVASFIPAQAALGYLSGVIMIVGGAGLLIHRMAHRSEQMLFWFLLGVLLVGKLPPGLAEPLVELHWLDFGQIAVLVAGAWALGATHQQQIRRTQFLLGFALIPIGISHFVYWKISTTMVPSILPYPRAWVYFTGSAHIAAGLGLFFGVLPKLAALAEGWMLVSFTVLVWLLPLIKKPSDFNLWVDVVVTLVCAAGCFVVASKSQES